MTGKETYTLFDSEGKQIYDGPEYILAHELAGHAIPYTTPSIFSDNRDTGYAVDSENIIRRETNVPQRALTPYSLKDTSFPSSQGFDIPWKRSIPTVGFMQQRIFRSLIHLSLKRFRHD